MRIAAVLRFMLVLLMLCFIASANTQDKIELRLHLREGQTFDQGLVSHMQISHTVQQRPEQVIMITHTRLHNRVLHVDAEGLVTIKSIFQSIDTKRYTIKNGKKSPLQQSSAAASRSAAAMRGKSFLVTFRRTAKY